MTSATLRSSGKEVGPGLADLRFAVAGEARVHAVGDARQLVLADGLREGDELLLDGAFLQHHDHQRQMVLHRDELKVLEAGPGGLRRRYHRSALHRAGQQRGGHGQPLILAQLNALQLLLDLLALARLQLHAAEKVLDKVAVAQVGGDAAGGGVRVRDVPFLLEDRHLVADGGRADAQAVLPRHQIRRDGHGRAHVLADDETEDPLLALGQLIHPTAHSGQAQ